MASPKYPLDGSKWFDIREYVHPLHFNPQRWERARWYVSDFQRDMAETLRELLGQPIFLNNWHNGDGGRMGRGTRPPGYRPPGGAALSQHYLKCALDVSGKSATPAEILKAIEGDLLRFQALGLTTVEDVGFTKTWLHLDCRPRLKGVHPDDGLLVVRPG